MVGKKEITAVEENFILSEPATASCAIISTQMKRQLGDHSLP